MVALASEFSIASLAHCPQVVLHVILLRSVTFGVCHGVVTIVGLRLSLPVRSGRPCTLYAAVFVCPHSADA